MMDYCITPSNNVVVKKTRRNDTMSGDKTIEFFFGLMVFFVMFQ